MRLGPWTRTEKHQSRLQLIPPSPAKFSVQEILVFDRAELNTRNWPERLYLFSCLRFGFNPSSARWWSGVCPPTRMAGDREQAVVALELKDPQDESVCRFGHGYSFGATNSVAGELVFQTGMVGYPESITDPSYRGQILVITFPLVGNYGVPSRDERDDLLKDLPAHFEAAEIHIAGLIVASYSGQDFSHHLAASSLGQWLKEQNVPAVYGIDTRDLTKRIREKGSMLGRLLMQTHGVSSPRLLTNGITKTNGIVNGDLKKNYSSLSFETIPWRDPNGQNLVAEGTMNPFISK